MAEAEAGAGIAVIGMAGRFPGASDLRRFERNLLAGHDAIAGREALLAAGLDPALLRDPSYVPAKGLLEAADCFDAAFFGLAPRVAAQIDPQHRLFLECAWQALEDAGYPAEPAGRRIGVFAGASAASSYLHRQVMADAAAAASLDPFQAYLLNQPAALPTLVAYHLNLTGPALALQTACSTGLAAVVVACQNLLDLQCDLALAGGVALSLPLVEGYRHVPGSILSPDGRCRPFDVAAAGTVPGNGVGAVVLKRLDEALADGDRIDAVIRGFAMNNDGRAKIGFTAPSAEGQAQAVADALAMAGLEPAEIGFVETHGTATALGDAIEIEALRRVFAGVAPGACLLGSVKAAIGHLDTAAGIAGLIAAVLAIRAGRVPPSPHFTRPNPALQLEGSPFAVSREGRDWPSPRAAGVSSFGIGGTNVHVVLQEGPPAPPPPPARAAELLPLAAASPAALRRLAGSLAECFASADAPDLAAAAWTLQSGRRAFPWRAAVAARSAAEAAERLAAVVPLEAAATPVAPVFLFPGQGAQHAGMAAELLRRLPPFRAALEPLLESLAGEGVDLRPHLLAPRGDAAAESALRQTSLAQPALFAVGLALADLLRGWGVQPAACLGHSVGEYAAACVAGVLDRGEALRLVAARGRLMQALPAGAMLSLRLGEAEARRYLRPGVELAAVNAADLTVLAGPGEAVAEVAAALAVDGVASRLLQTSHAFHSAMMEPALAPFRSILGDVRLRPPALPLVANLTGGWLRTEDALDPARWAEQLRRPVRFAEGLATLAAAGHRVCIELGPGSALTALAARQGLACWPTLSPPQGEGDDLRCLLEALGGLWSHGVQPDWPALWPDGAPSRVSLPAYPFERERHWMGPADGAPAPVAPPEEAPAAGLPAEAAVIALWRRFLGHAAVEADDDFLRLGGDSLLAVRLAAELNLRFAAALEPHELLQYPTPRRLAARLQRGRPAAPSCRVQLREGEGPPLVLFHAVGGTVHFYGPLVAALPPGRPVIAFQSALLAGGPADPTVEAMTQRYLDALAPLQPRGPYLLAGSSFGGMLAYEAARRLTAAGERVALLALLDSPGPGDLPRALADDAEVLSYIAEILGCPVAADLLRPLASEVRLARFIAAAAAKLPAGITPAEFAVYLEAFKRNTAAMRAYDPPPLPGQPLLFFKAAERDRHTPAAPERAWQRLLGEAAVEVVTVPGGHLSMMEGEEVRLVARRLQAAITASG